MDWNMEINGMAMDKPVSTLTDAKCSQRPCIFSWPMVISNSVNEFFVAV